MQPVLIRVLVKGLLSVAIFIAGMLSASMFQCSPEPRPSLAVGETVRIDTIRIDTTRRVREQPPVQIQAKGRTIRRDVLVRDFDTHQAEVDSVATVTSDSTLEVRPFVVESNTVFLPLGAWFKGHYKFPENEFEFTVQPPPVVELEITRWIRETQYVEERRPLWQDIATHALVAGLTYAATKTFEK